VDETTALTECGGRGRTVLVGSLRASDAPTTHSDAVDKADRLASIACGCVVPKGPYRTKTTNADKGQYQALSWVSILVVDIFPPNILGQSNFALSDTQREYWYMKYPRM